MKKLVRIETLFAVILIAGACRVGPRNIDDAKPPKPEDLLKTSGSCQAIEVNTEVSSSIEEVFDGKIGEYILVGLTVSKVQAANGKVSNFNASVTTEEAKKEDSTSVMEEVVKDITVTCSETKGLEDGKFVSLDLTVPSSMQIKDGTVITELNTKIEVPAKGDAKKAATYLTPTSKDPVIIKKLDDLKAIFNVGDSDMKAALVRNGQELELRAVVTAKDGASQFIVKANYKVMDSFDFVKTNTP